MIRRIQINLLILITTLTILSPAAWSSPLPIGSIVGSKNAILDGQRALPDTAVLSGDSVQVNDGLAMITLGQGSRMILGHDTDASFLKEADGVTVSLNKGNMSLYHAASSAAFRVKVGDITVAPAKGYKTLGEVAMADGVLQITAKDGSLQVEQAGTTKVVDAGKTITVSTTPEGAPTPEPPGNRHWKHPGGAMLFLLGAGAGAGTATAIILATRSSAQASPVAP